MPLLITLTEVRIKGEKNNPHLPYAFSKIWIQKFINPTNEEFS